MSDTRKVNPLIAGGSGKRRQETEVANFLMRIDDMLDEETRNGRPRYGWCEDTLTGIRETVERSGRVSEGQVRAVDNIENARHVDGY